MGFGRDPPGPVGCTNDCCGEFKEVDGRDKGEAMVKDAVDVTAEDGKGDNCIELAAGEEANSVFDGGCENC